MKVPVICGRMVWKVNERKFEEIRRNVPILEIARHLLKPGQKPNIFYYPGEKTASIKVYPETGSFFDFGRCVGGDCIRLWSHICHVNSWMAAQSIAAVWGLNLEQAGKITAGEIKQYQQAKLEERQARKQVWRRWRNEVDYLKARERFYMNLLVLPHVKPLSDPWCCAVNDLQIVRYKLDGLCGIE